MRVRTALAIFVLFSAVGTAQELVQVDTDIAYPAKAREARIQGAVKLECELEASGDVRRIKVLSGHPLLVAPSLDTRRRTPSPTCSSGRPCRMKAA